MPWLVVMFVGVREFTIPHMVVEMLLLLGHIVPPVLRAIDGVIYLLMDVICVKQWSLEPN